jgi:hypothetical protein
MADDKEVKDSGIAIWLPLLLATALTVLDIYFVDHFVDREHRSEVLGHITVSILGLLGTFFLAEFFKLRTTARAASKRLLEHTNSALSGFQSEVSLKLAEFREHHERTIADLNSVAPYVDKLRLLGDYPTRTKVLPGDLNDVWIALSSSIRSYYWATNSIPLRAIYQPEYRMRAIGAQAQATKRNKDIRKMFFLPEGESPAALSSEIVSQRNQGIKVRFYPGTGESALQQMLSPEDRTRLASYDFGVFDDSCVLLWFKEGGILHGEMIFNKSEVLFYKKIFDYLYGSASEDLAGLNKLEKTEKS